MCSSFVCTFWSRLHSNVSLNSCSVSYYCVGGALSFILRFHCRPNTKAASDRNSLYIQPWLFLFLVNTVFRFVDRQKKKVKQPANKQKRKQEKKSHSTAFCWNIDTNTAMNLFIYYTPNVCACARRITYYSTYWQMCF